MTIEEGLELARACIGQLATRFLASQPKFIVKIVTKDGVRVVDLAPDSTESGAASKDTA